MKRMVSIGSSSFLACLAIAMAVYGQDVKVDYDHSASLQGYKTYTWAKGTPAQNPLNDQRIIDAVDGQLSAKGFEKVDANANPDLVVLYHAGTSSQTQLNTTSMGPGWGWGWSGGMTTTTVQEIPMGQLSVDIGDAKTKKLLWLGSASGTMSDKPEKNTDKINKAVAKMFKDFPPPPAK